MKERIVLIIKKALQTLGYADSGAFGVSDPPDDSLGDYASNAALIVSKQVGKNPMAIAAELALRLTDFEGKEIFSKVQAVAPGFINFTLAPVFLIKELKTVLRQKNKYARANLGAGQKILVEYFQPNIAKPLHLGHLRTAIIGDALFKILNFTGFKVKSDTHLGDWGTQFGLLLAAYKLWGKPDAIAKDPINELNKLYVRINAESEKNPALREKGKAEFLKLEKGDEENRKLWQKFADWSWPEFKAVYKFLQIRPADNNWGESFYEDKMPAVVEKLKKQGLLISSEGAQIVDLSRFKLGVAVIIKSDGATTYLLRDLATFIYRKSLGFKRQLYVVDTRQSHSLAQTFKILECLGEITSPQEAVHVDFGYLSLPEGAMSTRRGTVIGPMELLRRAQEEVLKIIQQKNPDLQDKENIAWQVARGAIKYFDLVHNRKSDIVFRWEEALSFEGNAGPYLQYTHARAKSILRKKDDVDIPREPRFLFPEEWLLIRMMAKYSEVISETALTLYPHYLAEYLFLLAGKFNNFYQKIPVLKEKDNTLRASRLMLTAAAAQILKNGLELLGIEALEEM
ncbi:MAG: arginine--tRNA ligase [Patescibacteria group bacterium]